MMQLTLNSKSSNTIKKTSFFANFEQDFKFFEQELSHKTTQEVIKKIEMLKKMHETYCKCNTNQQIIKINDEKQCLN